MTLLIISTFTGLATEAIKKILDAKNVNYSSNILAGIVAVVLSVIYGGFVAVSEMEITTALIVKLICLVFLSWLSAMVGYDKVKQAIKQISGE